MSARLHLETVFASSLAGDLDRRVADAPRFCRGELSGRLTELSSRGAGALLTMSMELVLDAQREGEPVAWVMLGHDGFYVPDVARAGVDLDALAVVRAPDVRRAVGAAARLARSGAFGLIVIDLSREPGDADDPRIWLDREPTTPRVPPALLSRLIGLTQKHDMAVVFLTTKPANHTSLDSLISLRAEVKRGDPLGGGRFRCDLVVEKDKRRGPCWSHGDQYVGPPGVW